jgi:hypothetical protein
MAMEEKSWKLSKRAVQSWGYWIWKELMVVMVRRTFLDSFYIQIILHHM